MNESTKYHDEMFDVLYRELTQNDVDHALYTLKSNQNLSQKQTDSSDNETSKQQCDCCRLLRSNTSSRLFLPLARRGRPHFSSRSHRLLCPNCTEIKRQQQIDILQNQQNHIYQTTINLNLSSDEQNALNNQQYESNQMLIWKIDRRNENTIDLSYDTGSLSENEKKILLDETIKKLQVILNNHSTIITDNIDFTYRTLQTTINILSSSHNSV